MVFPPSDNRDQELLEKLAQSLAGERELRPRTSRVAFTAAVLAQCREKPKAMFPGPFWRLAVAAALVLALLATWLIPRLDLPAERARKQRLGVAQKPVLANSLTIHAPLLLQPDEGQRLVMLAYDYYGERCLWLYPERLIRWGEDPEADADFRARPKWYGTVTDGRIPIDAAAIKATFGEDRGDLVLLKVGNHYEIWEREALARFLAKSG